MVGVTPGELPAALRCEYCLLAEDDAFLAHESDHIIAVKHGGATDETIAG